MKRLVFIGFIFCQAVAIGVEPQVPFPPRPQAPRSWLGLDVSKPDESITAHLPSLPPGIGFVIRTVTKTGPGDLAGLREFDVLWKLGDQMLVNEGQLAALLRLSKPGDEIALSGFRGGQPLEVKLKLGEAPEGSRPFPDELVDEAIMPGECRGPMRVVNVAEKLATYSTTDGKAQVSKEGEGYKVKIEDPQEQIIYEGSIQKDGNLDKIPDDWKRRVHALRRGLDHALEGRMMPVRQPRPRVVPPPEAKP